VNATGISSFLASLRTVHCAPKQGDAALAPKSQAHSCSLSAVFVLSLAGTLRSDESGIDNPSQ